MSLAVDVVKRGGKRPTEKFDRDKLHRSIKAACLSLRTPDGLAEDTASGVCDVVILWLDNKPEVTSDDIRNHAAKHLEKIHPEAGFIYRRYRFII